MIPLFKSFPKLQEKVAYQKFANLNTPVEKLNKLGQEIGLQNLYIKRDDQTGDLYGGNKVRKLEFILAEAKSLGKKTIVTVGGLGTHHGLATTIYGKQNGLDIILFLARQPATMHVRNNLLADFYYGAKLLLFGDLMETFSEFEKTDLRNNPDYYFLPAGGSIPCGMLSYVNAVFELKEQIDEGICPEPDYVFLPVGTAGTLTGLILGSQLVDLKTKFVGIRVIPFDKSYNEIIAELYDNLRSYLAEKDEYFSSLRLPENRFEVLDDFVGTGYGHPTEESKYYKDLLQKTENITLETTYTAKAFDGLISYVKDNELQDKTLLFWNTFSSIDISYIAEKVNWKDLPSEFHEFFTS